MPFQTNSTLQTALWIYKPDPAKDPIGKEFIVNLNVVHYIECNADHTKVWLFFPDTGRPGTQAPYTLEGEVAKQFMNDVESIFS